jgi:TPR repeat protein
LQKIAEQDNAEAQYYLGLCYREGIGIEKNEEEAVKWFRKAAEQDHYDAQKELARLQSNNS